jgi:hypothetical protein
MIYQEACGCIFFEAEEGNLRVCAPGQSLDGMPPEVIELAKNWTPEQIAGHDVTVQIKKALEEQAEATRQALFAEYDKRVMQYQREIRLGMTGAEARLAAWDAYAEALRAINDVEGWYRDPQWPQKPEI